MRDVLPEMILRVNAGTNDIDLITITTIIVSMVVMRKGGNYGKDHRCYRSS